MKSFWKFELEVQLWKELHRLKNIFWKKPEWSEVFRWFSALCLSHNLFLSGSSGGSEPLLFSSVCLRHFWTARLVYVIFKNLGCVSVARCLKRKRPSISGQFQGFLKTLSCLFPEIKGLQAGWRVLPPLRTSCLFTSFFF